MKFLNLCNPENRRAAFFRDACERLGLPEPAEFSWLEFLYGATPDLSEIDTIRIESPGENFEVEKHLIELGGGPTDLEYDLGRVRFQSEWYRGWQSQLNRVKDLAGDTPFLNSPEEIEVMFHKWNAQQRLLGNGVPIPSGLGLIDDYNHLISLMEQEKMRRVFLKPIHSSSASGVVAFQMANREKMLATTSAELIPEDSSIYNSLRLRNYRDEAQVRQLVDTLTTQSLMAEAWFPKASLEGKAYDLRVLVIGGKSRQVVIRTSRSPITNLHLGNARGDVEAVRKDIGEPKWEEGMEVCENAANAFPGCHYVAVDLMISSSKSHFAVAEVNAFGDLIPNITSSGDDTYTAELRSYCFESS